MRIYSYHLSQFGCLLLTAFFTVVCHSLIKYLLSLDHTFLKYLDKLVKMSLCVLRQQTDPQSSLTDLDNGVFNSIDVDTLISHQPGDYSADYFVADEDWHDGAGITYDLMPLGLQTRTKVHVVLGNFFPAIFAFLVAKDVELGERSGSLNGVDNGSILV